MMLNFYLIVSIFIITHCSNEDIISLPVNAIDYMIQTKYGFIKYRAGIEYKIIEIKEIYLEGIQKIYLYNPPSIKGVNIHVNYKKVLFLIYGHSLNIINFLLCDLFYQTQYISKKIYSVENGERENPFRYFGGTPKYIVKDLKKFTFYRNDIPEINIDSTLGKIYYNPNDYYEFNEDSENNCASFTSIYEYQDYFFQTFEVLRFKIGNNIITLNVKNEIEDKKENEVTEYQYQFSKCPCEKWVFFIFFLNMINVREFKYENEEVIVTLYISKDKKIIADTKDENFFY